MEANMRHMVATLAAAALSCAACAQAGGGSGGGENLPSAGVVPWSASQTEDGLANYIVAGDANVRYSEPAVWRHTDRVQLWLTRVQDGTSAIVVTDGSSLERLGSPEVAIHDARDPAVASDHDGVLWLAWIDEGSGAIVAARVDESGVPTQPVSRLVEPRAGERLGAPSLAATDDGWLLVFSATPSPDAASRIDRVWLDADRHARQRITIVDVERECADIAGVSEPCWDADGVGSPDLKRDVTALGRTQYRLFFAGERQGRRDIGFAASFDGTHWSRYAFNPVLGDTFDESGPASLRDGDRTLLLFTDDRGAVQNGITFATLDE